MLRLGRCPERPLDPERDPVAGLVGTAADPSYGRQPLLEGGSYGGGDLLLRGVAAREIEERAQGVVTRQAPWSRTSLVSSSVGWVTTAGSTARNSKRNRQVHASRIYPALQAEIDVMSVGERMDSWRRSSGVRRDLRASQFDRERIQSVSHY